VVYSEITHTVVRKESEDIMLRLKLERKNKNMTQVQVAEYLKIYPYSYQRIELGIRKGSIDIWDKLEDLFEVPQRQLRMVVND